MGWFAPRLGMFHSSSRRGLIAEHTIQDNARCPGQISMLPFCNHLVYAISPQVPRPWDFPPPAKVSAQEGNPMKRPSDHPAVISPLPQQPDAYSLLDTVAADAA